MLVNSQVCEHDCTNLHGLLVHTRVVSGHLSQSARTSGLHLGNDSRGGNGVKIRVRKHTTSRGVWGHAPPRKFLYFGLSQIASDAFSGT